MANKDFQNGFALGLSARQSSKQNSNNYNESLEKYITGEITSYTDDSAKTFRDYAFAGCKKLKTIKFPDDFETFGKHCFDECDSFYAFDVSDNSENFSTVDGVLYTKDKEKLIYIPQGIGSSFAIPDGVKSIEKEFCNTPMQYFYFPASVDSIHEDAFMCCDNAIIVTDSISSYAYSYGRNKDLIYVLAKNFADITKLQIQKTIYTVLQVEKCLDKEATSIHMPERINDAMGYYINSYAFKDTKVEELIGYPEYWQLSNYCYAESNLKTVILGENRGQNLCVNSKNLEIAYVIGQEDLLTGHFKNCTSLRHLVLRDGGHDSSGGGLGPSFGTSTNNGYSYDDTSEIVLENTPILKGEGYVYVLKKHVSSYQSAWPNLKFRAVEDYTVDGTNTGLLSPNKI